MNRPGVAALTSRLTVNRWQRSALVVCALLLSAIAYAEKPAAEKPAAENISVVIRTNLGDITVALNAEAAPKTVANFLDYVDRGAYTDTIFHRVIPGFMIQGGGYYADLSEAPEVEPVFNEAANGLKNKRGTIAMARMDEIDSARRNFFINVANNRSLDHSSRSCSREDEAAVAAALARGLRKPQRCRTYGYAVFGEVTSGMDVIELIEASDTQQVGQFDDVPRLPVVIQSIERIVVEP